MLVLGHVVIPVYDALLLLDDVPVLAPPLTEEMFV
jgi:hypothetical protein